MAGVNKVIIVGNLGRDPDARETQSGTLVTNIAVATSEKRTNKQTGEVSEETQWHKVVFFGRLAEVAEEYLRKGSKVYVEGRLRTQKWQDRDGNDRYTTEVLANQMQMLDSRSESSKEDAPKQRLEAPKRSPQPQQGVSDPSFDDDIPF